MVSGPMASGGVPVTVEKIAQAAEEIADPRARECHILPLDGSMIALCGFDCRGRTVHSTERCVLERHARCFECARREGGGVDRFLRDVLDDRPF